MGRISALTELTTLASDDYLVVLDSSANIAKKITIANAFGITDFGWTASGESWTYSSWSSTTRIGVLTVPTDATTKYVQGMKIKITQSTGGTKYGTIIAVTSTSLSIFFGASITLNNEAITSPQYSIAYMPLGYTGPVLTKEAYQSDTTNSERWIYEQSGWGVITISTGNRNFSETVTFGLTYASRPVVTGVNGGDCLTATGASYGNGANVISADWMCKMHTITTTAFVSQQVAPSNVGANGFVFYQWAVRGPVS